MEWRDGDREEVGRTDHRCVTDNNIESHADGTGNQRTEAGEIRFSSVADSFYQTPERERINTGNGGE